MLSIFLIIPAISGMSVWGSNPPAAATDWIYDTDEYIMANMNITYFDEHNMITVTERGELGKFGSGKVEVVKGRLVHVVNNGTDFGCDRPFENVPSSTKWIALVRRGRCYFDDKIEAALFSNASAVIVYNNRDDGLQKMALKTRHRDKIVSVFLSRARGEQLARLLDNGTQVNIVINAGSRHPYSKYTSSRYSLTSVMFVSISFIVLMMISLAWLIFYYIQRFRYLHARDQLNRQMTSAAQRAVSKIPTRTVKASDIDIEGECCAVCIEPFKTNDLVRLLPCKHEYHKLCIDPWLLDHRTCPMCKMDILKHYGYVFAGSQESIINMDLDTPIVATRLGRHLSGGNNATSPGRLSRSATPEPQATPVLPGGRLRAPRCLGMEGRWTWGRGFIWGRSDNSVASQSADSQNQSDEENCRQATAPALPAVAPLSPSNVVVPTISVIDTSNLSVENNAVLPVFVPSASLRPPSKCVSVRTL